MVAEKLEQVPGILQEFEIDAWMLWVRESATIHDPCLDLVVGANITWVSAFILTAAGDRIAIVGNLDRANVELHGHYREIQAYLGGVTDDLRRVLERLDPRRLAVNYSVNDVMADGLSHGMFLKLQQSLAGTPYLERLISAEPVVSALRGRKSPTERERIRQACDVTVGIFDRLTPRLRAGLSEKQVAAMILEEVDAVDGLGLAWDADHCPAVFTGPDSAGAHAGPTDREIEGKELARLGGFRAGAAARRHQVDIDLQLRRWWHRSEGACVARPRQIVIRIARIGGRRVALLGDVATGDPSHDPDPPELRGHGELGRRRRSADHPDPGHHAA